MSVNTAQLARRIAELAKWPESDILARTRRLREMRMLPQGGHGINAPEVGAEHVATVLCSLAARTAVDAVHAVSRLANLPPQGTPFAASATFAEALELILSDPNEEAQVQRVVMCQTWPEAQIVWKGGSAHELVSLYRPSPDLMEGIHPGLIRVDVTLPGEFLGRLARDLVPTREHPLDGFADTPEKRAAHEQLAAYNREQQRKHHDDEGEGGQ